MGSLTAHLLEDGDHRRLGFHPRCPVCRRERLYGSLRVEPVIFRRVQAAIAAGALAFSAAAPAVAAAQEPDYQQEGVVAPEQSVGTAPGQRSNQGPADDPAFDPGTDPDGDDAVPLEGETPEPSPLADEDGYYAAPVEPEPVDDPYAGDLVPDESESEASPSEDAPVPPVEAAPEVPAPPPPDSVTVESPTTEVEGTASPNAPDAPHSRGDHGSTDTPKMEDEARETEQRSATGRETWPESAPVVAAPQGAPVVGAAPAVGVPATASPTQASGNSSSTASNSIVHAPASTPTDEAPRVPSKDSRIHIVRPGESLWSIAKKRLGPSATPAQIAREVNRLWELNKDRIATGNPDLLMPGVKLRLR